MILEFSLMILSAFYVQLLNIQIRNIQVLLWKKVLFIKGASRLDINIV